MLAGRVLAGDVVAPFGLPRFTNSAMDGFAVRWVDVQGCTPECPVMLRVTDDILPEAVLWGCLWRERPPE